MAHLCLLFIPHTYMAHLMRNATMTAMSTVVTHMVNYCNENHDTLGPPHVRTITR